MAPTGTNPRCILCVISRVARNVRTTRFVATHNRYPVLWFWAVRRGVVVWKLGQQLQYAHGETALASLYSSPDNIVCHLSFVVNEWRKPQTSSPWADPRQAHEPESKLPMWVSIETPTCNLVRVIVLEVNSWIKIQQFSPWLILLLPCSMPALPLRLHSLSSSSLLEFCLAHTLSSSRTDILTHCHMHCHTRCHTHYHTHSPPCALSYSLTDTRSAHLQGPHMRSISQRTCSHPLQGSQKSTATQELSQ